MPQVVCPQGHRLQVPDRHIGQVIKCPSCQSAFVAEAAAPAAESSAFNFNQPDSGDPSAWKG